MGKELKCVGRRVKLFDLKVRWEGKEFHKDLVAFGESVAIVPLIGSGEVLLLRQWRPAIMDWITEIPAGRVEPGESPHDAALRELKEETGYEAGSLVKLSTVRVSPGYSNELMHIYLAKELREGKASPEEGEVIRLVRKPLKEALEEVLEGGIDDLKTVAGILLVAERLKLI